MKEKLLLLLTCITIVGYAQTTAIPDAKFEQALINLGHDDVIDGAVVTANISNVENLTLDNLEIVDLTGIEDFTALKILSIFRNSSLTKMDLSKNTELTYLNCYGNFRMQNFDFSKNTKLTYLNLGATRVTSIDVSNNTALTNLYLQSNELTSIDLSKNTELVRLSLSNNNLEELDITNQTKLGGSLELGHNLFKSIDLSTNLDIQALLIDNTLIKELDVSQHTKLIRLHASGNSKLERLNVKNGANGFISTSDFSVRYTPRLSCIQVDNATWSTTNWTQKDVTVNYNENCEPITWSGNISSDWTLVGNWEGGKLPSSTDRVLIPSTASNFPTINTNTTVKSIVMESGTTLVANAEVSGYVTYKRNLATTNWYLMGVPLNGEGVQYLRANNVFATGKNNNIGMAYYNNENGVSNRWEYQKTTSYGGVSQGKGFAVKLTSPDDFFMRGFVNANNVSTHIKKGLNSYNLLSNPYLAMVNSKTFLNENTHLLESETIWIWNQATNSYETKVSADDFKLAPGQGFFVKSKVRYEPVVFSNANQSHGADTFQRNLAERTEIKLNVFNGELHKYAKVYFSKLATNGFDNGYDGELFSGVESKFEVYTELLENNTNKKFQIQSLPNVKEHTVVPIGIKAEEGEDVKFSIDAKSVSSKMKVYIEDKEKEQFFQLDGTTKSYSAKITEKTIGTGRFFLHITSKVLTDNTIKEVSGFKIVQLNSNALEIVGVEDKTSVYVYSIQGKLLKEKQVSADDSVVELPRLSTGVYLVKVVLGNKQGVKKIIIN